MWESVRYFTGGSKLSKLDMQRTVGHTRVYIHLYIYIYVCVCVYTHIYTQSHLVLGLMLDGHTISWCHTRLAGLTSILGMVFSSRSVRCGHCEYFSYTETFQTS